ncbi:MAG: hypothetical protein HFJ04_00785 [Lachnospiraceae bacterium]|nr:hypothetical protein [Lachnospiraceae bacterium]
MKKVKEFLKSPAVNITIFVLAVVLLLFSSVGGARAALTYVSEYYSTRVQMYDIGVTLEENGKAVSKRDYNSKSNGSWDEETGELLTNMLGKDEDLKIGKTYQEELTVKNSGTIDQYVRVSIYRYWLDKDGNKMQELSPELIDLNLVNSSDWVVDKDASTSERTVLYYTKLLKAGKSSSPLSDTLAIDNMIATKVSQTTETNANGLKTITTTYDYDGVTFNLEAKVDAVQDHNAEDAIWSAWGRKVAISNNTLRLK